MSHLLLLTLLLGSPAPAAGPATIAVRVALDDRTQGRLAAPELVVDQPGLAPVAFRDDGSVDGDVVKDGILMAAVQASRQESLHFGVRDGGVELAAFDVVLPASGGADFALKTTAGTPAVVLDLAAPPMPGAAGGPGVAVGEGERAADDRIQLRVLVDDRAVARLQEPRLVVDQSGVEPAALLDDGSLEGDTARDRIFVVDLVVARAQYLTLYVRDRGVDVGAAKVFLPSTSEAEVNLLTLDGADGIELKSEPTATGGTDGPDLVVATRGGGDGHFTHVLWVGIALFAMGFAYVRAVVADRWEGEVRPLLERLRAHLDRAEGEE